MTPLVLVHGFMGGSEQWNGLEAALADHMPVIPVDLPGFGRNAHKPAIATIEGYAAWVVDELSARGVDRYDLLGHSMGGMVAQEIARQDSARVRKLILYATGPTGVLPGRFETIAESKMRAEADGAAATARRIAATWFLEREAARGYDACARIAECAPLAAIHAGLDAMEAWSGEATLPLIAPETLIIWGDQDRTYDWAQIHKLWNGIAKSHLAVLPACAHAVHLERPALFSRVLLEYLEPNAK